MRDVSYALPAGYTLLEYRIDEVLGAGGFGLTYLAHDTNLNAKVAIKEYLPIDFAVRGDDRSVGAKSPSTQKSFDWGLKRFLDESRTLASFHHPNIVRVMRFFEANRTAYMVMEFISGKPLHEWIALNPPLEQSRLAGIAFPLLSGLEVVHQKGYLHRDIKPPNIFIRDEGAPVLIDFGSARMNTDGDQTLTAIVTPGFAPLEQYHAHGKQGPWTDIYSLAGVLYWLVTGKKPVEAAARVREDIMPAALEAGDRGRFTTELLSAIDWGLKPYEQDRPQSVAQWRSVLGARRSDGRAQRRASDVPGLASASAATVIAPTAATTDTVPLSSIQGTSAFDREMLKRVETELSRHLGPIAGVMVKNAARKAATAPDLAAMLAPEIADERARAAFLRRISSDVSMPPSQLPANSQTVSGVSTPSGVLSVSTLQRFTEETLRRAEASLAQHIGAVAKVVVRRAAQKARNESELYLLLADEIEDKVEKKNFIRRAISVSGKL